ncbi:MAG: methyltransferase domain-containing protein [Candidatus Micrarchaeota archaeon]
MWPIHLKKLKRGPQVVLAKDAGLIISFAGICKESKVLDVGAGSGWLAIQIARVAKKVISYEAREEFAKLAEENVRKAGLDNVEIRIRDVLENGFDEKEGDVVCIDMANAHLAVKHAINALKEGGIIVGYLPHAEQLHEFVKACENEGFADYYAIEGIVREMLVRKAGVRPENVGIMHTAYLVFARKGERQLSKRERKKARKGK